MEDYIQETIQKRKREGNSSSLNTPTHSRSSSPVNKQRKTDHQQSLEKGLLESFPLCFPSCSQTPTHSRSSSPVDEEPNPEFLQMLRELDLMLKLLPKESSSSLSTPTHSRSSSPANEETPSYHYQTLEELKREWIPVGSPPPVVPFFEDETSPYFDETFRREHPLGEENQDHEANEEDDEIQIIWAKIMENRQEKVSQQVLPEMTASESRSGEEPEIQIVEEKISHYGGIRGVQHVHPVPFLFQRRAGNRVKLLYIPQHPQASRYILITSNGCIVTANNFFIKSRDCFCTARNCFTRQ